MTSFDDLGISAKLIDAMNEMGWTEPTPIQCEAVPVGIAGNDLIAKAQTGTGKTGAYSMIVMSRIGKGAKVPSALVITPTRELAMQVDAEIRKLSKFSGHVSTAVYGGAPIERQITALRRGADIIVGTPGRLRDMIDRKALDLSSVREVVLDEADRMLDMGFEDDLDFIMGYVPDPHQTLLFSATLDKNVRRLAGDMLDNPAEVDISGDTPTTGLTKQYIITCKRNEKKGMLYDILANGNPKSIVFFATKLMVDEVYTELKDMGYKVGTLHGDMSQKLRERVIGDFRDNRILTLLATDVASRGLDVIDVDLVVNFDLPIEPETYVHRIGRTGRAGKEGISISLVNPRDRKLVRMCEDEADTEMERVTTDDLEPIEAEHEPVLRERIKKEKKMKVEKHRNNSYKNKDTGEREGFATLEISLGKADGVNRTVISDFLKQRAGVEDEAIGKVGLKDECSFVEVSLDHSDFILENLDGCEYEGKTISIKLAPRKERNYSDVQASSRVDPDGFDRRRENRYKNYQKRMEREAEAAQEESGEGTDDYILDLTSEGSEEKPRREYRDRYDDRGYGRREGGYRDRGYRDRGYSGERRGGYRDRGFGDREYVRRDFRRDREDGDRHEGGYGDRHRYSDRPRRDYDDRRDGGYRPRRDHGYREGGYREHREGGFHDRPRYSDRGDRREGGYRPRREGGYSDRPRRDYGDRREGGRREYSDRPRRDYGERREERPRRDKSDAPKRYPSNRDAPKRYPSNRDKPKSKKRGSY